MIPERYSSLWLIHGVSGAMETVHAGLRVDRLSPALSLRYAESISSMSPSFIICASPPRLRPSVFAGVAAVTAGVVCEVRMAYVRDQRIHMDVLTPFAASFLPGLGFSPLEQITREQPSSQRFEDRLVGPERPLAR